MMTASTLPDIDRDKIVAEFPRTKIFQLRTKDMNINKLETSSTTPQLSTRKNSVPCGTNASTSSSSLGLASDTFETKGSTPAPRAESPALANATTKSVPAKLRAWISAAFSAAASYVKNAFAGAVGYFKSGPSKATLSEQAAVEEKPSEVVDVSTLPQVSESYAGLKTGPRSEKSLKASTYLDYKAGGMPWVD